MSVINKQHLKASLAITTTVGCKNNCSYCPQKTFIESYRKLSGERSLSMETFSTCLQSVPKRICLSFSGFAEPWLNPDCTRMVLHAHRQGFTTRVNTTLIGMHPQDIQQLGSIPFLKFVVHLPDDHQLTRIRVDETYLQNIVLLLQYRPKNLMWKFHQSSPEIAIHPAVNKILREHREGVKYVGINSRAGKVDTVAECKMPNLGHELRSCQDFHHNILLPNGDVALCHMDWGLKHILGNLLTMDYGDLYSGKAFQKLLDSLMDPEADILCRECEKDNVKRSLPEQLWHHLKRRASGEGDLY